MSLASLGRKHAVFAPTMMMSMKSTLAAVLLAALALLTVGCSTISSGTVIDKVHEPEHQVAEKSCRLVGKIPVCTTSTRTVEEQWKLVLNDGEKDGWVYVDEDVYDDYEVGDQYR